MSDTTDFIAWWKAAPHRLKYQADHPAHLAAERACRAKMCDAKPTAWIWEQAEYREGDLRGRRWQQTIGIDKPCMPWMERNLAPLYGQSAIDAAVSAERHDCSIVVWMTMLEAEGPDADDKGVAGWLQEAERRVKERA